MEEEKLRIEYLDWQIKIKLWRLIIKIAWKKK